MSNVEKAPDVLIVEDDQGCIDLIAEIVQDLGHDSLACERIADALQAIETQALKLVILDVMLPDGDGFDVLKSIRDNPNTERLPVILCTAALFEVTEYNKPIDDPLTALVVKPFHIDSFIQVIDRFLTPAAPE
jgi:CheY-like chemotaxis protein